MKAVEKQARSLLEYASEKRKAQRRAACAVCRLPEEVRAQIRAARDRKIERTVIREWLRVEHKSEVSDLDFTSHYAGHHDEKEGAE